MYNAIKAGLWMALLCASNWASAQPSDEQVVSMIKQADDYRLKETSVIFKSAVEAGQKMLMLQDNYWLQMPKSRRPIRITPMQKLLGEASVGDISTLSGGKRVLAVRASNANTALTADGQNLRGQLSNHRFVVDRT